MKKQSVRFYLSIAISFFLLLGIIFLLLANATKGYRLAKFGLVLTFSIISLVLVIGSIVVQLKLTNKTIICLGVQLCAMILTFVAIGFIISGCADGIAALNTYDSYNEVLRGFITKNMVALGTDIVSVIIIIVSSFLKK